MPLYAVPGCEVAGKNAAGNLEVAAHDEELGIGTSGPVGIPEGDVPDTAAVHAGNSGAGFPTPLCAVRRKVDTRSGEQQSGDEAGHGGHRARGLQSRPAGAHAAGTRAPTSRWVTKAAP